jgi:amidase
MPTLSWSEWAQLDASALAALIRSAQLEASEVVAQAAEAARLIDPKLSAVVEIFADIVDDFTRDKPDPTGLLYGVPMFLKDLGSALAGRRQDSGSALTRGTLISVTDPTVENFLRAGLVPLGRSATPEFGMSFDTTTQYGDAPAVITRSPWNLSRTPGGSSGGSAALVAAGVTPVSMSTDGGGSTRIPAAFCGLVGLKASRGRVAQLLGRNEYGSRVSIDGVVTRSVRDTAAVFQHLTRIPTGGAFIAMGPPRETFTQAIGHDPRPLRVGLATGDWGRPTPVNPQIRARVAEVARLLERLGHHVEEITDAEICDWPTMWETYLQQWIGSRAVFTVLMRERGMTMETLRASLTPMTWRHYVASERYDKLDMLRMANGNNTVTRQWGALFDRIDVLLTPTLAIRVPAANGPYSLLRDEDLDDWVGRLTDACRFTMPGNETGFPAISLPAGLDTDALPIGAQFYAAPGRDDLLLSLAAQIERAAPTWFAMTPPVHVTSPG